MADQLRNHATSRHPARRVRPRAQLDVYLSGQTPSVRSLLPANTGGPTVLTPDMRIISVDDHIIEHPRVWSDRLPAKHQAMGPHIVELEGGRQEWSFEGNVGSIPSGMSAV